jgi:aspartate/methionine/tyrosine aminotransferase
MSARIAANLRMLDGLLDDHPECRRLEIQGGWYAVLRIPALRSDEDFCLRLIQDEGLLAHPGHFFDFACDGHVVTSLILPGPRFEEGASRLLKMAGNP